MTHNATVYCSATVCAKRVVATVLKTLYEMQKFTRLIRLRYYRSGTTKMTNKQSNPGLDLL